MDPLQDEGVVFAKVVKALREAQKLYFKTRKKDDLIAAKRLEASIDVIWLPQILEPRRSNGESGDQKSS